MYVLNIISNIAIRQSCYKDLIMLCRRVSILHEISSCTRWFKDARPHNHLSKYFSISAARPIAVKVELNSDLEQKLLAEETKVNKSFYFVDSILSKQSIRSLENISELTNKQEQ